MNYRWCLPTNEYFIAIVQIIIFAMAHGKKFEEKPHQDAVFKPSNISGIVATRKSDRLLGEKSPSVTAVSEAAVSSGFFTPNKRSDYRGSIIPQKSEVSTCCANHVSSPSVYVTATIC
jgi:hypothetical protein